jgi:integrase/recombinase XerC
MREFLKQFLKNLEVERNLSPHTIRAYKADLESFITFLEKEGIQKIEEIIPKHIRIYLTSLMGSLHRCSVNRKLASIRSFFKSLLKKGYIKANPAQAIFGPKLGKGLPQFLTVDEIFRLLDKTKVNTPLAIRDRALLEILYATGIRVSELVGLNLGEIDLEQQAMRVYGKGRKYRFVFIGKKAREALDDYLKVRKDLVRKKEERALFLNVRGGRLSGRSVERIVKKYGYLSGIFKHVYPHMFRHSFASHFLNQGADLKAVQELLGHASLATTQKYTHISVERLMEVYDKTHPRS